MIRVIDGKHVIFSEDGKRLGEYATAEEARERLRQIEYFKDQDARGKARPFGNGAR